MSIYHWLRQLFVKPAEPKPGMTMGRFRVKDCTATLWYRDPVNEAPIAARVDVKGHTSVGKRNQWGLQSGAEKLLNDIQMLPSTRYARIGDLIIHADRFICITDILETERIELYEIVNDPDLWPAEVLACD